MANDTSYSVWHAILGGMPRVRRIAFVALAALALGAAGLVAAWVVDTRGSPDQVLRNTTLAGRDIGGRRGTALDAVVADVAHRYTTEEVEVHAPGGGFRAAGAELGLTVDVAATRRAALDAGRQGSAPARFAGWVRSFVTSRSVPVRVAVDDKAVRRVVATKDPGPRTAPTEPEVRTKPGGSGFTVEDGKKGKGIDAEDLVAALPEAAARGSRIVVELERADLDPRFSRGEAEALAKRAEEQTAKPLAVTAGGVSASVPVATLRSWVHSEAGDDGLRLAVDGKKALDSLGRLLAKAAKPPTQTTFVITGGAPQPRFGAAGSACCSDNAPALIAHALFADGGRPAGPLSLPMRPVPPNVTADDLPKLGITTQVSTFTTRHPAGQPRVTNIHRIADIVKGQLIRPGETFSVNAFVGERTIAKGFVVDHQINDEGKFDEAVGGGVSQFATTTFNAGFFAGLEFPEYQSHTIYISRYPYGREATISWQHPDLKIKNTTPYGVVLWATYTDTSLTVSMWSTPYFSSVTQSAQTAVPFGPGCTRVKTDRTRTYLDGRTDIDSFFALYQPAEGVKCR